MNFLQYSGICLDFIVIRLTLKQAFTLFKSSLKTKKEINGFEFRFGSISEYLAKEIGRCSSKIIEGEVQGKAYLLCLS